ncbi:MAG: hypothetical protein JW852_03195, partial [Spirochaetales bacterium]|nr:hypothetical protein [Spirochaetales bacterium]
MRLKKQFLILAPILVLLFFLLWPLGSRRWDIVADENARKMKETILERQARVGRNAPRIVLILADDLS